MLLKTKLIIVLMTVLAGSCCTKKYCIGSDDMDYIQFNNFLNSELDTITIQRFSKNSNFATVMEDITVVTSNFSEGSDFQHIQLPVRLTIDYDYIVKLNSTGENFTISDFVSKKEDCNTGFMCNDSYNALKSYLVNGNLMSTYQIEISK
ncbi:hypothetical protein [Dyadobacter sp. CY312]|uniref:hypothetical protein n=1 Tax=Dyadobacter sp. CY312 TaxID=2907303 RepID=UPI001F2B7F6A|nr:hypothetical protein [Dyadobacter sp. CY312]MCE7043180.1 hypothetical protein [Dyadobacter sp. CY312]